MGRGRREKRSMFIAHSFQSLQETFEARASEWMLTGAVLSLGMVFAFNTEMFYKEAFEGLRDIYNSQAFWANLFLMVGFARLCVLVVNGSYYRTPHFRTVGAFLCSGVWFIFWIGFVRNGSVLMAIMPWIFLLDAYNCKRTSREAGISEFLQRRKIKEERTNARVAKGTHA